VTNDHETKSMPPSTGSSTPTPEPATFQLNPGDRVGNYVIREQIGEGGFAIVYAAEQERPVRRKVALKIIKLGMDTKQVIARFEAERQALAMMDHPNVAKVFDAGATETGRPFFVMEHVAGESITDYCDKQRMTIEDRLGLFAQVCEGVQHAHQKGIIHRDIKPSNVLVTVKEGEPQVKVIDFGVAKAITQRLTEKTIYTEQGQLIGTPEYMSPEQAEMTGADIDTRSDIYSLGVLLYELLTGALPFDQTTLRQAAFGEIQRIIREEEPAKPSTRLSSLGDDSATSAKRRRVDPKSLYRELRGDLDWIVMKALEKDRSRRYASASEFAKDLHRHRRGEPVEAAPPSKLYRLSRFVRRNQAGLNALVLICLFATGLPLVLMTAWAVQGHISATLAFAKAIMIIGFMTLPALAAVASAVMFLLSRNRRSTLTFVLALTLAGLLVGLTILGGSERGRLLLGLAERVNKNETPVFMLRSPLSGDRCRFRGVGRRPRELACVAPRPRGDEAPLPLDPLYPPEGLGPGRIAA